MVGAEISKDICQTESADTKQCDDRRQIGQTHASDTVDHYIQSAIKEQEERYALKTDHSQPDDFAFI